jgi:PAS domain-containing protein
MIVTFPKDDTAFAAFVRSTIAALDAQARVDPAQVQTALRRWHTRAQVRPQNALASLGDTTWYVYRDGHAGVRLEQDWWQADDVATARLGEDEVFVDGDDAACQLVDLPPGGLRGVPWRVLVPPEARETDGEWLFGPLKDGRPVQSVFDFPRADGSRRVIEYRTIWLPDERIYLCRWRELAVIDPGRTPSE